MLANRLLSIFGLGAWLAVSDILLSASGAVAQSYPCAEPMIVGNWMTGALGWGGVICQMNIGTNGALTSSNCVFVSPPNKLPVPPRGTLTIDSACHVHGTVSYTHTWTGQCYDANGNLVDYTDTAVEMISPQLWRSLDGSRLVNQSTTNSTCSSNETFQHDGPLDLILVPQPPPPP
jgi:hypothetical protein